MLVNSIIVLKNMNAYEARFTLKRSYMQKQDLR